MKLDKAQLTAQRKVLDARLRNWAAIKAEPFPRGGWIKALREALGMTHRQLATRMGTTPRTAPQLEQREVTGGITLGSLERAARALNCRLVYAIVPAPPCESLEDIVQAQALALARQLAAPVQHSMSLEDQAPSDEETRTHVATLAEDLARDLDSRIWTVGT